MKCFQQAFHFGISLNFKTNNKLHLKGGNPLTAIGVCEFLEKQIYFPYAFQRKPNNTHIFIEFIWENKFKACALA